MNAAYARGISRIFRAIEARLLPQVPFDGTSHHKGLWEPSCGPCRINGGDTA